MTKKAFISFDFDNDKALKEFVAGQAKLPGSPFTMVNWSMKEAAPQGDWKAVAEARIKLSDVVIVIVGKETHRAPGVLAEVDMARRNGIKIVQFIGYKDTSPERVPDARALYRWSWPNLEKVL